MQDKSSAEMALFPVEAPPCLPSPPSNSTDAAEYQNRTYPLPRGSKRRTNSMSFIKLLTPMCSERARPIPTPIAAFRTSKHALLLAEPRELFQLVAVAFSREMPVRVSQFGKPRDKSHGTAPLHERHVAISGFPLCLAGERHTGA